MMMMEGGAVCVCGGARCVSNLDLIVILYVEKGRD